MYLLYYYEKINNDEEEANNNNILWKYNHQRLKWYITLKNKTVILKRYNLISRTFLVP